LTAAGLGLLLLLALGAQVRRTRGLPVAPLAALLLLAAWAVDWAGASRSRNLEAHFVSDIMNRLARKEGERFVALPSRERLSREALAARVSLPLEAFPDDGDPRHWWSREYSLPAGRFRLSGAPPVGVTFYNGAGVFQSDGLLFSSDVALGRFRLRARHVFEPPRIFLVEARPSKLTALATISIGSTGSTGNLRLHALDDEVYPDPDGFWVRKGSRASFAIELAPASAREVRIRIANGGVSNVVSFDSDDVQESVPLAPWEERDVGLPLDGPVEAFGVESESGFRPRALDPRSRDDRELGVLVRARPPFDSGAGVPDNEFIDKPIPHQARR
jgi:hypothetical protein